MCALFGFLNYGKRVPWKILQKLVQAIEEYDGEVILVSHERDFYDGLLDYEIRF